jgi:hypothetical protein
MVVPIGQFSKRSDVTAESLREQCLRSDLVEDFAGFWIDLVSDRVQHVSQNLAFQSAGGIAALAWSEARLDPALRDPRVASGFFFKSQVVAAR